LLQQFGCPIDPHLSYLLDHLLQQPLPRQRLSVGAIAQQRLYDDEAAAALGLDDRVAVAQTLDDALVLVFLCSP
jgi:hypothetical protein